MAAANEFANVSRINDIFSEAGELTRALPGFEFRAGQLAMAEAVERALQEDRILLCEAGTGTGKTLAYLIPALLSGRRVVVSTATRTLQDQIVAKDLPLIERTLGIQANFAVMKGLGNYLCLRRYHAYRRSRESELGPARKSLAIVEDWARATTVGDVGELEGLEPGDPILPLITSSSETRVGSGCAYFEECFVTRMKRAALAAQLIVVNHHLFFADLALRGPHPGQVIPDYDFVIFDEAHRVEDIATNFFSLRVSNAKVVALTRAGERVLSWLAVHERGVALEVVQSSAAALLQKSEAFFQQLGRSHHLSEGRTAVEPGTWNGAGARLWHDFDDALLRFSALCAGVHAQVSGLELAARELRQVADELDVLARRADQMRADLAKIVEGARGYVAWVEQSARAIQLSASPVDVSAVLRRELFDVMPGAVLTSATLADGSRKALKHETSGSSDEAAELEPDSSSDVGSAIPAKTRSAFKFQKARLGLEDAGLVIDELVVDAPFDFQGRSILYVPRDLAEPRGPEFSRQMLERTLELVNITGGGAFILTTSVRVMHDVYQELRKRELPNLLLIQSQGARQQILEAFRDDGNAILVATMSFWEGVDVPGLALRLVIMDKLPFAVPTDPIMGARARQLESQGRSAFSELFMPSAKILLKQGFGRLLRHRADAGIVAVLDSRLLSRGYGKQLLAALPPAPCTSDLDEVRRFWRGLFS